MMSLLAPRLLVLFSLVFPLILFASSCNRVESNHDTDNEEIPESFRPTSRLPATDFDAKKIIDSLENHNSKPATVHNIDVTSPVFEPEYDWNEQHRIFKAIHVLQEHAEEAWPEMVAHLDDTRYSITFDILETASNYSIGGICRWTISDCISEAYYWHIHSIHDSESLWKRFRRPDIARGDLKSWCEARRDKKLYELQIEMCEWAIEVLKAEKKEPVTHREADIARITKQIDILRREKKAIRVKSFWTRISMQLYHPPKEETSEIKTAPDEI